MRPRVSVVIPAYNAEETIIPLLKSIHESKRSGRNKGYGEYKENRGREREVIVVDDKSKDSTIRLVQQFAVKHTKLNLRILALKKNSGPAHARNAGAKLARGEIIFFLDSDVILHKRSFAELIKSFQDPDVHALTGVWDKEQKNQAFFPKFKALRDWSYWINERDPTHYYYLFSTRVAAIRRDLFLRLGGFDETYKAALVEDIELTYRISKRYAVIFNPRVKVHHEFEGFWPIAKKYFWRSYYWTRIYRERKKFDPVTTTNKEAITTLSAAGLAGFGFLTLLSHLSNLSYLSGILTWIVLTFLLIHLWGVRKFLWFCYKEEGIFFAIKAFFTGIILYVVILAGAVLSMVYETKK
ncbi:glycosyltransferase family 2 protein [Candidatus Gottesmanbacteria bacterium]|nr:glycosyltransferase family 2 protein [Candidatus Gottesmanbacteria bacterium]